MFIRSERLFLRPGWPEEWQELHGVIDDEEVVRNLARAPWPYTEGDARAFLSLPQERMFPHFLITLPGAGGGQLIGSAGLAKCEDGAELGYWIAREHWGRGYASEAARAVLRLAQAIGHRRIHAYHFVDNPASGKVLEKVGFHRTGRIASRHSPGRGAMAAAREYALDLASPEDCDGDDDGGMKPRMAA